MIYQKLLAGSNNGLGWRILVCLRWELLGSFRKWIFRKRGTLTFRFNCINENIPGCKFQNSKNIEDEVRDCMDLDAASTRRWMFCSCERPKRAQWKCNKAPNWEIKTTFNCFYEKIQFLWWKKLFFTIFNIGYVGYSRFLCRFFLQYKHSIYK